MSETISFLGWTDEVTACDLCGKKELKSTAALEIDGEVVYYGCTCATRALAGRFVGVKFSAAKIARLTEQAHDAQIACGKAFDQGLNWVALESERIECERFRSWVIEQAHAYRNSLASGTEARRNAEFGCSGSGGAYAYGVVTVLGGYPTARKLYAAREVK